MNPPMLCRRSITALLVLAVSLTVASRADASDSAPVQIALSKQSEPEKKAAKSSEDPPASEAEARLPDPVDIADAARPLRMNVYSRLGYWTADGTLMIDVLEGDFAYATLLILDAKDRPVRGARPRIRPSRDSRFISLSEDVPATGDLGNFQFGIVGGTMGEEYVEISVGDEFVVMLLNVISARASGYDWLADIEGVLDWKLLMQAKVSWDDLGVSAVFPKEVLAEHGKTVKLVGFAMPLEATLEQKHFLLTSSPPGCFFHLPGGPSGAVEVFSSKPLSVGFEPIVLEGRFQALTTSEIGVVYRLHEARALDPPRPSPDG